MTQDELNVLDALRGKRTNIPALMRDTGLNRTIVNKTLNSLIRYGVIGFSGKGRGQVHFRLSDEIESLRERVYALEKHLANLG